MIKLFRNIRMRLLTEGKTTKYFKYAIGEIVLVVIGILIALQVNNLNTERLNKHEEQNYLKAIRIDLKKDSLKLASLVNGIGKQLTQLEKLKFELESASTVIKQDKEFATSLLTTFSFVPEKATTDDLKSSGNLNLISNQHVKDSLLSYYNHIDTRILALHTSLITYSRDIIAPSLMTNYSLEFSYPESLITENSKIPSLTSEQKQSPFLINAVKFRAFILFSLKWSYENLISTISRFQRILDKEIKT
jgi:hypothetical protein